MRAAWKIGMAVALGVVLAGGCGSTDPQDLCKSGSCCAGGSCPCKPTDTQCTRECVADCKLACPGDEKCNLTCDDACTVDCASTQICKVVVTAGSHVTCSGPGPCNVTCSDTCRMTCAPNVACALTCQAYSISSCPDGSKACGGC